MKRNPPKTRNRRTKLRGTSKEDKQQLTFSSVSDHELLGSRVCLFCSLQRRIPTLTHSSYQNKQHSGKFRESLAFVFRV